MQQIEMQLIEMDARIYTVLAKIIEVLTDINEIFIQDIYAQSASLRSWRSSYSVSLCLGTILTTVTSAVRTFGVQQYFVCAKRQQLFSYDSSKYK